MISVISPAAKNKTIAMGATNSLTVKTDRAKNVGIVFTWSANSAPNGTISLSAGNDPSRLTTYSDVTIPTQPAGSAGSCGIGIVDFCFDYIQVTYTRSSGGATDTLNVDFRDVG